MKTGIAVILAWLSVVGVTLASWITHVVYCIQHELWVFLIAGALAAPVGMIHGVGLWFGWWA